MLITTKGKTVFQLLRMSKLQSFSKVDVDFYPPSFTIFLKESHFINAFDDLECLVEYAVTITMLYLW